MVGLVILGAAVVARIAAWVAVVVGSRVVGTPPCGLHLSLSLPSRISACDSVKKLNI